MKDVNKMRTKKTKKRKNVGKTVTKKKKIDKTVVYQVCLTVY